MDFKQLKSFVTVAGCGSFTKAASQLYTSQSTISAHIHQLEEELKAPLFTRTTKSIQITEKGQEIYEYAVDILLMSKRMVQVTQSNSQKTIHIGASTIPAAYVLPQILSSCKKEIPDIQFQIHQGDSQEVMEGVKNGVYDLGLIGMDCEDELLSCIPFCEDKMVLITPANLYFLNMKKAAALSNEQVLRALKESPVILREKGSGSGKNGTRILESIGITEDQLHVVAYMKDQAAMINLVKEEIGVAIISEKAVKYRTDRNRFLTFELEGVSSTRYLYVTYRKNQIRKTEIREFVRLVKDFYLHML